MASFKPINETLSLTDRLVEQLRNAIYSGEYGPGDKLPSENELVEIFQVSRTSVREAMKVLAGQNLIVIKRGLGAFVLEQLDASPSILHTIFKEKDNLLELFQIRKILETEAAAGAAKKATAEDIAAMEDLLSRVENIAETDIRLINELNSHFHYALIDIAGNRTLQKVMMYLMDSLTESREITLRIPGRPVSSIAGHRAILEAIKQGNGEGARMAMRQHLEAVEETIKKIQAGPV